jgi:hypothetical protein
LIPVLGIEAVEGEVGYPMVAGRCIVGGVDGVDGVDGAAVRRSSFGKFWFALWIQLVNATSKLFMQTFAGVINPAVIYI